METKQELKFHPELDENYVPDFVNRTRSLRRVLVHYHNAFQYLKRINRHLNKNEDIRSGIERYLRDGKQVLIEKLHNDLVDNMDRKYYPAERQRRNMHAEFIVDHSSLTEETKEEFTDAVYYLEPVEDELPKLPEKPDADCRVAVSLMLSKAEDIARQVERLAFEYVGGLAMDYHDCIVDANDEFKRQLTNAYSV